MSGGSSEEKNLPPSQKKLRDARKKGQVAKSRDLVSAFTLAYLARVELWTLLAAAAFFAVLILERLAMLL